MAVWRTVNTRKVAYLESIGADLSRVIDEGGWDEDGYLILGAHPEAGRIVANQDAVNTRVPWPDRDAARVAWDGDFRESVAP